MEADSIVRLALTRVDEAEAYLINKEVITIRIADKRIIEAKGVNDNALAIRLVKDGSINAISTSYIDREHIEKSIDDAITTDIKHEEWKGFPARASIKPFNGYDKHLAELEIEDYYNIAKSMIDHTLEFDITNLSGSIHLVKESIELANSNSLALEDKATYIIATLNADREGSSGIGFNASRSLKNFKPDEVAKEASSMAIRSSDAKRCDKGYYSIVLEPYALGELLSFVFAYNFNAKAYMDKKSCLYGRLDQEVAVDTLTLYDDPRIDDGLGSRAFDDEGVEANTNILIDHGIFKNIIYDTFYAYKDGRASTGNGLRLGYPVGRSASMPFPSMHNIVLEKGDYTNEELIKDTRRGLLVGRLWYTYPVNPEQGDFSCTARSGIFLIENGEIKHACKMFRMIDNLKRLMLNISAISKERKQVLQWHASPCIAPMIRVDGVRVIPV